MFIQTENTPNPATIKFIPGQVILAAGTMDFQAAEEAASKSPLALRLFGLQGVARVFLGHDFVSITKNADTDWIMLKPMVLAALMEHLSTGQPIVFMGVQSHQSDAEPDSEIVQQIKELLDKRVRPAVAMDGGDIVFESFDDGVVYLRMQGACAGCPSSTATLKSGIENMLKHFLPEVTEVRQAPF
jgi:Fe-S cluster biogenesis protein NfuA